MRIECCGNNKWNKIPAPDLAFTFGFGFDFSLSLALALVLFRALAIALDLALVSSIIGFDAVKGGCTYSIQLRQSKSKILQNREKTHTKTSTSTKTRTKMECQVAPEVQYVFENVCWGNIITLENGSRCKIYF